jgi:predicted PurR-regulated permease PerM
MFNYKRLTFIFLLLSMTLVVTDSSLERQARKALLSLGNVVVEEGSEVTGQAPGSILDTFEAGRLNLAKFFDTQADTMNEKAHKSKNFLGILFSILEYLFLGLKYLASYVITFYPFVIYLFYIFFTSRFFKKDEFGYYDGY